MDYLKKNDPAHPVHYIQSGGELREFIKGDTYTQKICKAAYDRGELIPEFIVVYLWAQNLVKKYTGIQHIVCDGMPRKVHEAGALDSIFDFYKLEKPWVIYLDIGDDEAMKRLLARGRFDDKPDEINNRLAWYKTQVIPTINYYKSNPRYKFLDINGIGKIDDIHVEIVKKLGLK